MGRRHAFNAIIYKSRHPTKRREKHFFSPLSVFVKLLNQEEAEFILTVDRHGLFRPKPRRARRNSCDPRQPFRSVVGPRGPYSHLIANHFFTAFR
jgi:hypothetical protein